MQLSLFNIPQPKIELEELFTAYFECRKNKRNTANALAFEIDYENSLVQLCEEINSGTYKIDRSIAFIVDKPVKREIFASDFRDRVVHHLIIGKSFTFVKHYKTNACMGCQFKEQCTRNPRGRLIERPENAELIEKNHQRIAVNKDVYKRRQAIVEHPYGTIKRQWDFSYIMTKRWMERADADVGLMFTAYNLRRILNLVGKDELKKYLKVLLSLFLPIYTPIKAVKLILSYLKLAIEFLHHKIADSLKELIFIRKIRFSGSY